MWNKVSSRNLIGGFCENHNQTSRPQGRDFSRNVAKTKQGWYPLELDARSDDKCTINGLLAACFMPLSCFPYYSTLEMEATFYSETSVDFQRTIWRYIQKITVSMRTSNPT
jgi:hypothetical protein